MLRLRPEAYEEPLKSLDMSDSTAEFLDEIRESANEQQMDALSRLQSDFEILSGEELPTRELAMRILRQMEHRQIYSTTILHNPEKLRKLIAKYFEKDTDLILKGIEARFGTTPFDWEGLRSSTPRRYH